jgi:hypothetical protein
MYVLAVVIVYGIRAPALAFCLNVLWLSVLLGMLLWGAYRSKPGYVAAPFVFLALWFGTSLVTRMAVEVQIDPRVWAAPITPEARAQRALIINPYVPVARRIIEGDVDKLVTIRHEYDSAASPKTSRIEEITLAKGGACSTAEMRASEQLHHAGHIDECFKWRDLESIPDGLIVQPVDSSISHCSETQARLREHGLERVLFSWFQCESSVLSYIPMFWSFGRRISIWGFDGLPIHRVSYGQRDIAPKTMIHAIYEVPAPRRLNDQRESAQTVVTDIVADLIPSRPKSDR